MRTRAPWGIAVYTTIGSFVGLAAGLFFVSLLAGVVMIRAAMDAPWNCAALCHLPTVMTLFTIEALTLVTTTVILALVAKPTEPVSGPQTEEALRSDSG